MLLRRSRPLLTFMLCLLALPGCVLHSAVVCNPREDAILQVAPTVVDGVVYFGGEFGHLYAIRASDGKLLWQYETGEANKGVANILERPLALNGLIITRVTDAVIALDPITGARKWLRSDFTSAPPAGPIGPLIAGANGRIVIPIQSGLLALDATTGASLWQTALPQLHSTSPPFFNAIVSMSEDTVYVGADGVYALDAGTGNILWHAADAQNQYGVPFASGGLVYAKRSDAQDDTQPTLVALRAQTGAVAWTVPIPGAETSQIALADNTLYLAVNIPTQSGASSPAEIGEIRAVNSSTGATQATFRIPNIAVFADNAPPPVIANGSLYAGVGAIYKFPVGDASPAWQVELYRPGAPGAVVDGVVYAAAGGANGFTCGNAPPLADIDGELAAINATTGKVIWREKVSSGKVE